MDTAHFDRLARTLGASTSRRRALKLLAGGMLGTCSAAVGLGEAGAFGQGCLNRGRRCVRHQQCCSGVCRGPRDRKTCRAHDAGICRLGEDICTAPLTDQPFCEATGVTTSCLCYRTTGNAPYCGVTAHTCGSCLRDTDCEKLGNPAGTACVLITESVSCNSCAATGGTACVRPCPDSA
jgi:hypothetical protein